MEEHHIAHTGKCARVSENITGRCNKQDFSALPVKVLLHPEACYVLNFIRKKVEHILVSMGLNTEVISCPVTIGHGRGNPVNIEAHQVSKLPPHDSDFGHIDPIRAEKRTAAAFGTLVEVVP